MVDELREIYNKEGLHNFYFDSVVPVNLFRGQKYDDLEKAVPIIFPHPGFVRKTGPARPPDVKIVDRAGKQFVLGCRCTKGLYRGVSTFDRINPILKGFAWFMLPKGVELPPGLAITQDSDYEGKANHYTIAPKDDMLLEHFLMLLGILERSLQKIEG